MTARPKLPRWLSTSALALPVALAAVLPLLLRGPSCGQDFDFHLQSWLAARAAWHSGIVVPHWVPAANYGAGEPRLVFYPPLSWLLGALLGLVLPWAWAPAAFTAVCVGGATAAMHAAARRLCGEAAAAGAAVVYGLSPYLLFCALERTAYGELLAAVWMPLLLAALLRPKLPVVQVGALVAACWYTNAPAGVMGCYLVLLATIFRAVRNSARPREHFVPPLKSRPLRGVFSSNLFRGAAALLLGCGLAADYLLPAWYEGRWVSLARAVGAGMRVRDSWLFERTGEAYHDQVLRTASWIAVATLSLGLVCAVSVLLQSRARQRGIAFAGAGRIAALLGAIVLACLLMQFSWSGPLWRHLPELAFLQFPWRLLLPASSAVALLLALLLNGWPAQRRGRVVLGLLAVLFATGMTAWAWQTRWQPCDDEDKVAAQLRLPAIGIGFEGTDEYSAANSDNGEIQQGLPRVRLLASPDADEGDDTNTVNPAWKQEPNAAVAGAVMVLRWEPESLLVQVQPASEAYAVLRLERFPAWRVWVNGLPCAAACVPREDGLVTVHVSAARVSRIEARYEPTPDVWAGRALSVLAFMAVGALGLRGARQRRNAQL